jgi:hypothetical protein
MDPLFFTSALDGGEWSASRPSRFTPGTHWKGGWVGSRAGRCGEDKNLLSQPGIEPWPSNPVATPTELSRLRNRPEYIAIVNSTEDIACESNTEFYYYVLMAYSMLSDTLVPRQRRYCFVIIIGVGRD